MAAWKPAVAVAGRRATSKCEFYAFYTRRKWRRDTVGQNQFENNSVSIKVVHNRRLKINAIDNNNSFTTSPLFYNICDLIQFSMHFKM